MSNRILPSHAFDVHRQQKFALGLPHQWHQFYSQQQPANAICDHSFLLEAINLQLVTRLFGFHNIGRSNNFSPSIMDQLNPLLQAWSTPRPLPIPTPIVSYHAGINQSETNKGFYGKDVVNKIIFGIEDENPNMANSKWALQV